LFKRRTELIVIARKKKEKKKKKSNTTGLDHLVSACTQVSRIHLSGLASPQLLQVTTRNQTLSLSAIVFSENANFRSLHICGETRRSSSDSHRRRQRLLFLALPEEEPQTFQVTYRRVS
jgi:hypothetical protein